MSTLKINCKIGVTTGEVFAGCVGNDRRCEYAVIGPKVGKERERERDGIRQRERWGERKRGREEERKRGREEEGER
jgi:hypothetical protein